MLRRNAAIACLTLFCPLLPAQQVLFDDFRDDPVAEYLPLNGNSVISFDQELGLLIVRPESPEEDYGVIMNFRAIDGIEKVRCHRLRFRMASGVAGIADGGGAQLSGATAQWNLNVYDTVTTPDDEYTLMTSSWEETSPVNVNTTTEKTSSDGTTTTVLATSSTSLISFSEPQWDRFPSKDGLSEEIELKRTTGTTSDVLFPKADPPPTITNNITAVFNGGESVTFDFVQLEDDHITVALPLSTWPGLALILVVTLGVGVFLLGRRRTAPARS